MPARVCSYDLTVTLIFDIVTPVIGVAALVVAFRALHESGRAAKAAERAAEASERAADSAEATDRRNREPQLTIMLSDPVAAPGDRAIYRVRNDGPQDLDSILIYPPTTTDRITYPIAITGAGGWQTEPIELGPLALTHENRLTLCCGTANVLPEFHVRIEGRAGNDRWDLSRPLTNPRDGSAWAIKLSQG